MFYEFDSVFGGLWICCPSRINWSTVFCATASLGSSPSTSCHVFVRKCGKWKINQAPAHLERSRKRGANTTGAVRAKYWLGCEWKYYLPPRWKKLNSLFGKENVFVAGILSNQEVAGLHHLRYNTKLTTLILKTHQRLFPANKKKHDCELR